MVLVCTGAEAAGSGDSQPSYALTVWTPETGIPSGEVLAATQDLDGYLWLGTTTGLVRFDGFQFVAWGSRGEPPLPGSSVPTLAAARDGGIWIGFGAPGGVARIAGGKIVSYVDRPGAPAGSVFAIIADRQGRIWAGTRSGLYTFAGDQWTTVTAAQGLGENEVYSLYEDRSGALWAGTGHGVYRGTDGVFQLIDRTSTNVQNFAEDDAGVLWVTDTHEILKRLDKPIGPKHGSGVRLPASGWRLLRDRRGHVWVAALGGGLLHMSTPSEQRRIERFAYEHKIAGAPRSLFEDRDGNIWVGVRGGGLLRLSDTSLTNVPLEGLTNDGVRAVAPGADGSVWIATGYNLNRFDGHRREVVDLAQTLALYSDREGTLWASTAQGLGRIADGRYVPMTSTPSVRWGRVVSLTSDAQGTMFLCSLQQGVMTWDRNPASAAHAFADLAGRACSVVHTDRQGRLWIGLLNGDVIMFDKGVRREFTVRDGLGSGRIMRFLEDKGGAIWVSSFNGISRLQNDRFVMITKRNGPIANVIPTLVEDADGYIWAGVQGGAAVIRFHPREMDKVSGTPAHNIEYALYDAVDGMQGALHWQSGATGVRGGGGRLWFATGVGLVSVDPHNLPRTRRSSTPRIDGVFADARKASLEAGQVFPSDTSTVRISFAAVNLSAASKLRFRYSLAEIDRDWIVADSSREAVYTNLPPGNHRFRVSATTDGQWTEAAIWEFAIAAPFYQQRWFCALSILAVVAFVGASWGLRGRAMRRRYALIVAERARVSREIHDTLLQNLGAIGLELEAVAMQVGASNPPVRDAVRRLRRQVGHSLREARESIWELRNTSLDTRGLPDSLQALADATTTDKGVSTTLTVVGHPARSAPEVDMQLFRIAQEAVNNAVRHGQASEIRIKLVYDRDRAVLSVTDNGCGFTVEEHDTAPAAGEHLGLLSMRERAARIRGRFNIWSDPGHGTTIEAVGPLLAE
jgi:signal transduction histidine kinase/ligand-binding sensor domain-containing protein